jgi:transcriptional regulator with XRE-family HTH domain
MKTTTVLLPAIQRILNELGENIKLARKRRKITAGQIAERANIARSTLWQIENGSKSVSMGSYIQVLLALGLEKDVLKIAAEDKFGRKLQDVQLLRKN